MQPGSRARARALFGAVVAVCLTAAIASVGAFAWWRTLEQAGTPYPALRYALGACRAFEEPSGAEGYRAAASMASDPWLIGADVGVSARLADGRMLWAFGDTFRVPDGTSISAVRNSMLIAGLGCRRVVLPPDGGAVIPARQDGVGYWPMSIVVRQNGRDSMVTVFAERVRGDEQAFDFVNLGPAMATYAVPAGQAPELVSVEDLGPDSPSRATVGWGAAAADGGDGYLYLYGTANPDAPMIFGWSVRVARTTAARLDDASSWEYWTGNTWAASSGDAAEVISAQGGVSQTFSVFALEGRWYALSKLDGDLGTDLAVWSAPRPWGPFGDPVSVGQIPNDENPSILRYMPLAHPQAQQSGPRHMLVSISRNSLDPHVLADSPSVYRPFFVDIELPPKPSSRVLDPRG